MSRHIKHHISHDVSLCGEPIINSNARTVCFGAFMSTWSTFDGMDRATWYDLCIECRRKLPESIAMGYLTLG